jgi:hypothetical protein
MFRASVAATLIGLAATQAAAAEFRPTEIATMRAFEGEWGFLSAKPAGSLGTGFAGASGECGAPKALHIDIRRDDRSIDPVGPWRVRFDPAQPIGPRIVKVENLGGRQRLTGAIRRCSSGAAIA